MKKSVLFLIASLLLINNAFAQYEEDVESVDSIIEALYASISGDAGEQRDWDRFKNLFIEEGRLIPTFQNQDGSVGYIQWSLDEYIQRVDSSFFENGFHEDEISREVDSYRYITQVFSTYQSKRTKNGDVIARGINTIQVLNDGNRYWIVSVFWSSENEEFPIPDIYLKTN